MSKAMGSGASALSAAWPGLRYLSLGVLLTWMYLVMDFGAWMTKSDVANTAAIDVSMCMYLVSAIELFAAAIAQRWAKRISQWKWTPLAIAAISAVGALLLIISGPSFLRSWSLSSIVLRAGAVLCGMGLGLMTLRVGRLYCTMGPSKVLLYAVASELTVAVLFYIVNGNTWFTPLQNAPALVYLIAVVVAPLLVMFLTELPPTDRAQNGDESISDISDMPLRTFFSTLPMMRKLLFAILAFSAAASIVCNCFMVGQTPDDYQLNALMGMLLRMAFALSLLVVAVFYAEKISLGKIYLFGMVALATIIIVLPMINLTSGVLMACTSTLLHMMNLIIWCLLAFVAKASGLRAHLVFGLGKGCSFAGLAVGYALNYLGALADVQATGLLSLPAAIGLTVLIVICVVLVFTEKDFDTILEVSGATKLNARAALIANRKQEGRKKLDKPWQKACWVVGERALLSNREQELLEEISRNRTPQEIAQKLDITVATVRTHTHRVYAKLDVHSRDELIDLVRREFETLE